MILVMKNELKILGWIVLASFLYASAQIIGLLILIRFENLGWPYMEAIFSHYLLNSLVFLFLIINIVRWPYLMGRQICRWKNNTR